MLARHATEEELQRLYKALVSLRSADDAAALLEDICTIAEVNEMAQRLEVALLLDAGESYLAIQEKTGSSPTTIARVSKALNYGPGGYARAIEALRGGGGCENGECGCGSVASAEQTAVATGGGLGEAALPEGGLPEDASAVAAGGGLGEAALPEPPRPQAASLATHKASAQTPGV
jgi:TrpR-related protein YerC/YecD